MIQINLLGITLLLKNIDIYYQILQNLELIPLSQDKECYFLKNNEGMTLERKHWCLI